MTTTLSPAKSGGSAPNTTSLFTGTQGTFAHKLFDALTRARESAPNKVLTKDRWLATVNELAALEGIARQKKPKGAVRARNPLYDALALATGTRDLTQLTRAAAKAIAVALADILAVTPDLTVDEINRRASAYKRRWPDARNHSAPALAKHWATFGGTPTRTGFAVMEEPKEDWRAAAKLAAEDTEDFVIRRARIEAIEQGQAWYQFSADFRKAIFDKLTATKTT